MKMINVIPLNIAELAISEEPSVISTILGSCVSVCLFSQEKKIGGMIHYALPVPDKDSIRDADEELRYGSFAIPILIEEVCRVAEVKPQTLQAKIIGGAAVLDELKHSYNIGALNVQIAEEVLKKAGIRIVGRDVGGKNGRKVLFYTDSGRVRVSQIAKKNAYPTAPVLQATTPAIKGDPRKKKVLIIDDSKTIRELLMKVLKEEPQLEVVGTAENPIIAEKMITELKPDVLTLDVHMPEMDGVTFLEKLLPVRPIPVVMITSISMAESDHILRALELGAVDYIQKPSLGELKELAPIIRERVLSASNIKRIRSKAYAPKRAQLSGKVMNQSTIVAIGASTGGTEALKDVLTRLPKGIPPMVIVQHIPPIFSTAFSKRLNELCPFEVKEAQDGDLLMKERVLIAPGGKQMAIEPCPEGFRIRITDDPPMSRHKPSVDYLFHSVAKHVGNKAIGIILTGMGSDGAQGLLKMKEAGAPTIGQDEASCVVYGMPRVAFECGAVTEVHPLDRVPEVLVSWLSKKIAV